MIKKLPKKTIVSLLLVSTGSAFAQVDETRFFEAEEGDILGAAQIYFDGAASGEAGVAYLGTDGNGFSINNVPESQSITVIYASPQVGDISVYVNGEDRGNLFFPGNGVWAGSYSEVGFNIDIPEGSTFTIVNNAGDAAMNVDAVRFNTGTVIEPVRPTPLPVASLPMSVTIEAENTWLSGKASRLWLPGASNDKVAANLTPYSGQLGFRVPIATESMTFSYQAESDMVLNISSWGKPKQYNSVPAATGGFQSFTSHFSTHKDAIMKVQFKDAEASSKLDTITFNTFTAESEPFTSVSTLSTLGFLYGDGMIVSDDGELLVAGGWNEPNGPPNDPRNELVRKYNADGSSEVFLDGLGMPVGIGFDKLGNFYVANCRSGDIGVRDTYGNYRVLANFPNGECPAGLALNSQGEIFVSLFSVSRVVKIGLDGTVTSIIEPDLGVRLPVGITFDEQDNLYVSNLGNGDLFRLEDGVPKLLANLGSGINQIVYFEGYIYVPLPGAARIDRVSLNGNVENFAGNGTWGRVDGDLADSMFSSPAGIAVSPDGKKLYVIENWDGTVRVISKD